MEPIISHSLRQSTVRQSFHREIQKLTGVPVEVTLGNPAKDCLHFGICRIDLAVQSLHGNLPPCGCRRISAVILRREHTGVELFFSKKQLSEAISRRHFSDDIFLVETAYPLPAAVNAALGLENFTIKPRAYPAIKRKGYLVVVFG